MKFVTEWSDRVIAVLATGLVLGAGLWAVWLFLLAPEPRGGALQSAGFLITLVLALITVLTALKNARGIPPSLEIGDLADLLAASIYGQWRRTADERTLLIPAPIQVRWKLNVERMSGGLPADSASAELVDPFSPLPGCARITNEDLRRGGGRRELQSVFAGLTTGRLVVVGPPRGG